MPLELHDNGSATLTGVITVDEVEQLAGWLRTNPKARISLKRCNHLHTGALQALLLFRPRISVAPTDAFLANHVLPLLTTGGGITRRPEGRPP